MRTCCIPDNQAATQEPEWTGLSLAIALTSSTLFHQQFPPGFRTHTEMLFRLSWIEMIIIESC